MSGDITISITGVAELERKLGPQLVAGPISRFLRKSGHKVMAQAQQNVRPNVFEGTVWNSFAVDLQPGVIPTGVTISNNAQHAVYLEKGTRPHFPPVSAVAPWAIAHGWEPYVLARHIGQHGTKKHPFLVPALEQSVPAIKGYLQDAAREIEAGARG